MGPRAAIRHLLTPTVLCLGLLAACETPPGAHPDDPAPYLEDRSFRRAVLERDLLSHDNLYARRRLDSYALEGEGWDLLPTRDPPSRALTDEDRERLRMGLPLQVDPAELASLEPPELPVDAQEWAQLGRRVMAEYPLRADLALRTLASEPGGLERAGYLRRPDADWVGARVFLDDDGEAQVAPTCGQCHCSDEPWGELTPTLGNKAMDVGLGPGLVDVLPDGVDAPFAVPDLGGLASMPYLQQNANWVNSEPSTLAIRCETLFVTANGERSRIPRTLAWAIAVWIRSQPFPPPLVSGEPDPAGREVFEGAGCPACHPPPDYTSDRLVSIEEVGTDVRARLSPWRVTGYARIPSLRGVGRTGPYLHDGSVSSLPLLFSPKRGVPGHPWGQELGAADRAALVRFLESI